MAAEWTRPQLVIPTSIFPNGFANLGFLTPTPVSIDASTIRVYGGMRDSSGISRIGWAEIDTQSRSVTRTSCGPAIELGDPGEFDDHGMILGDIVPDPASGEFLLLYVGFQMSPVAKFRAFSGIARSADGGKSFSRDSATLLLDDAAVARHTDIVAVHWAEPTSAGWHALVAVGDGWERIKGTPFPRYNIHSASGANLQSLTVSEDAVLTMPEETYRLGRPRMFASRHDSARLVATGGKLNGDYRPYAFSVQSGEFREDSWDIPVFPGCTDFATIQASYPTQVFTPSEEWVFFNGDDMGRHGALLITRPLDRTESAPR